MDDEDEEEPTDHINPITPSPQKRHFPTTLADLRLPSSSLTGHDGLQSQETIYKTLNRLRKSTLSIPNRLRSVLEDAHFVQNLWNHLNESCPPKPTISPWSEASPSSVGNNAITTNAADRPDHNRLAKSVWAFIPNERSGSWPLDPELKLQSQQYYLSSTTSSKTASSVSADLPPHTSPIASPTLIPSQRLSHPVSAYFKSTDGHINQWSFSLRRLNLPVLSLLGQSRGAVLIDTTRRGKTYPDALRRTVPIYTCVWNHVLFPDLVPTGVCDFQPCNLAASETAQIRARIPQFVTDLKGLGFNLDKIRNEAKGPTRCVWVAAPAASGRVRDEECETVFEALAEDVKAEKEKWNDLSNGVYGVNILVCCSASRRVIGAEMSEDGYIQGSGDDSEQWSYGLTAKMFWDNKTELMAAMAEGSGDMEELVKRLVHQSKVAGVPSSAVLIQPTSNLFLSGSSSTHNDNQNEFDIVISCNRPIDSEPNTRVLSLGCKDGKVGSKILREKLAEVKQKVQLCLQRNIDAKILVTCSTGKDLSVGAALTLLCSFYSDTGSVELGRSHTIDKQFIKQRLAWISSAKPDANPSRATLQAVNSFLIERPP